MSTAESQRRIRRKRRAAGLCVRCDQPAKDSLCSACKRNNTYHNKHLAYHARRAAGVCVRCGEDSNGRTLCPGCTVWKAERRAALLAATREPLRLSERQPGDAYYRCAWCGEFKCEQPLKLCSGCQAEYQEMMAGMPAEMGD